MNSELIDPCSLPWLPLAEKSQLPTESAIYFLMDGTKLLYISTDPRIAWLQCEPEFLTELESSLQKQFKPQLNQTRTFKERELRAYVPRTVKRTVKAIAGLKNSGRDWSLSNVVTEALEDWLKKPKNAELVKRHKLDALK